MIRIKPIFKKATKKREIPVFWNEISTMPFYYWRQIHETGSLEHLIISGKPTAKEIKKAWHVVNNQYLQRIGLDTKVKLMLNQRRELCLAMARFLATGDRDYEMEIDLIKKDIEIENRGESKKTVSYVENTAAIEKFLGFQVNEMKTSVEKYFHYENMIKQASKKSVKHG